MTDFWTETPPTFFKREEFDCKCGCGLNNMAEHTIRRLDALRAALGHPVTVSSGTRCPRWNKRSGGASGSRHMQGLAADLALTGPHAYRALQIALDLGFNGVGVAKTFLHVDDDPGRERGTLWSY